MSAQGRPGCVVPKRHPGDAAMCAMSCWQERIGKGHCPAARIAPRPRPVDWDSPTWGQPGQNVHVASNGSDVPDRHTSTEEEAERDH